MARLAVWRGHPRDTYQMCLVEWLERTGYYGMRAVLVLFMVAPIDKGGLGWSNADALTWYGAFTGAVWCAPLLGGWLIDRWLGLRRAVSLGAACLLGGYGLLWASAVLPDGFAITSTGDLRNLCHSLDLPLGHWPGDSAQSALAQQDTPVAQRATLGLQWVAALFVGGLALIVVGTAFFKPSLALLVGMPYRSDDPARERAYLLYYLAIYAAVLVAGVGVGTVGESLGWDSALLASALFVAVALGTCLILARSMARLEATGNFAQADGPDSRLETSAASAFIGLHALIAMVFWAAYEQSGGLMTLFIADQVDREVWGFVIPATWFFSLTAVVAVAVSAPLSLTIGHWEQRRGELGSAARFALGLIFGAFAFTVVAFGSWQANSAPVALIYPLAFYTLLTIGELVFSPTGFAMPGRYAPRRHQSAFMGLWLLSVALGSYAGGLIGAWSEQVGRTAAFVGLAALLLVAAVVTAGLRRPLARLAARRIETNSG